MKWKCVFGVMACGALAVTAWSAPPPAATTDQSVAESDTRVFELGEMLVVAGRRVGQDATSSVIELDADDIRLMGAKNAADILHHLPGTFVRVGNAGDAMARVRGYRQRDIKVVVDGVPVANPYTGRHDLQQLPASNIAKIRLIRGGSSVLYGPNAMGGVIEIITKKAGDKPSGSISVEAGDDDYWRSALHLELPWESFYANIALDTTDRDGFPVSHGLHPKPYENGNTRENSDLEQFSGTAKLGWESADTRLALTVTGQDSEYGMPYDVTGNKSTFERVEDMDTLRLALIGEHTFSDTAKGKLALFHNGTDVLRSVYDDETFSTQVGDKCLTEEAKDEVNGGSLLLSLWFSPYADVNLSYGAEQSRREASGFEKVKKKNNPVTTNLFDITDRTMLQHVAIENTMHLNGALSITTGARADSWEAESREEKCSWNVGASWEPLEWLTVTPAVYRRTRFPILRELYDIDRGNAELNPAELTGTSVDLELTPWPSWTFRAALFHDDIDNLIIYDRDGTKLYQNISKARHRGVEIGFTKNIAEGLVLAMDYSYLDAEDRSGDVDSTRLQYRPRHKIDTRLTYVATFGLEVSITHTYLDEQYTSTKNNETIRSSSVFDLAVSQQVGDHARVFARANNLFDYNYSTSNGIPAAGRALLAGVELTF